MARRDDEELTADEKFNRLLEVLAHSQKSPALDMEALKTLLLETNRTARKEAKPENETHPGKSVFSYPEGDVARPKPTLDYPFFYNSYPCHKFPETEHWRELELMRQVQPGEYTVMRKDFSLMKVTVTGERDADSKLTAVRVEFPVSREEKALVPPKHVVLYQLVYPDNPRKRFMEAMQEYVQIMLGEGVTA